MAHEARTDFLMLIGMLSLLLTGGGRYSVDQKMGSYFKHPEAEKTESRN